MILKSPKIWEFGFDTEEEIQLVITLTPEERQDFVNFMMSSKTYDNSIVILLGDDKAKVLTE